MFVFFIALLWSSINRAVHGLWAHTPAESINRRPSLSVISHIHYYFICSVYGNINDLYFKIMMTKTGLIKIFAKL